MEKISNILPPSNRVRASEVSESQPVRPGAPSFGRVQGRNSLGDRLTISQKAMDSMTTGIEPKAEAPLTYKPNVEATKQQVISKLSENFFNPKVEVRESNATSSEQVLRSMEETSDLAPETNQSPSSLTETRVPLER